MSLIHCTEFTNRVAQGEDKESSGEPLSFLPPQFHIPPWPLSTASTAISATQATGARARRRAREQWPGSAGDSDSHCGFVVCLPHDSLSCSHFARLDAPSIDKASPFVAPRRSRPAHGSCAAICASNAQWPLVSHGFFNPHRVRHRRRPCNLVRCWPDAGFLQ